MTIQVRLKNIIRGIVDIVAIDFSVRTGQVIGETFIDLRKPEGIERVFDVVISDDKKPAYSASLKKAAVIMTVNTMVYFLP